MHNRNGLHKRLHKGLQNFFADVVLTGYIFGVKRVPHVYPKCADTIRATFRDTAQVGKMGAFGLAEPPP